jgi:hypothetical protein
MSEGTESYDTGQGSSAGGALAGAIDDVVDALALPLLPGSGHGSGYDGFAAAYGDYRTAVTDRLAEQQRVGGLVTAMMDAVHRRLGRAPLPVLTGRIR